MTESLFDHTVCNPPYQDKSNSAIFHYFQYYADSVANTTSLIYPAEKWMRQSGKGRNLDAFYQYNMNINKVSRMVIYKDSTLVFGSDVLIEGGVNIVFKIAQSIPMSITIDSDCRYYDNADYIMSLDHRTNNIVNKTLDRSMMTLAEYRDQSQLFNIPSDFIDSLDTKDYILCSQHDEPPGKDWIRLFTNDKKGKQGRGTWFWIRRSLITRNTEYVDKYSVSVSKRSTLGQSGICQQACIYKLGEIHGDIRMHVKSFDTYGEACRFFLWLGHPVIRFLTDSSARRVNNYGMNVNIDDNVLQHEDIEAYIAERYHLSDDELHHIQYVVSTLGNYQQDT